LFHPDFPPHEPYLNTPDKELVSVDDGALYFAVAEALIAALENGRNARELGSQLASLLDAAINRQDAMTVIDHFGIYERLAAAPVDDLKILHNSFLVDLDGRIGEILVPA